MDGDAPGVEDFAREQNGAKAAIKLDFVSRQYRDEVANALGQSDLKATFMFACLQKSTIDCEINGNLGDVLDDMAVILQASGSHVYIQPVGSSRDIQEVAEDDVMSAFSLWMAGRMSGQIETREM